MSANNTLEQSTKNTLLTVVGKTLPDEDVLTEETVWANLALADQMATKETHGLSPVVYMGMAVLAYFALYPSKTPADLEREFRERNFDSGLIAVRWRDDPKLLPRVERGDVVVRHIARCKEGELGETPSNLDYYVMYSCRPRKFAEKEMFKYATSAEQNLARLEEAGDLGLKNRDVVAEAGHGKENDEEETKVNEETGDTDARLDKLYLPRILTPEESDFSEQVREGRVRLCFRSISMESEWQAAHEANPEAKEVVAMALGIGPICLLVGEDGKLACPYGRFKPIEGEIQYVPLET